VHLVVVHCHGGREGHGASKSESYLKLKLM
jgi:hypothetical protein